MNKCKHCLTEFSGPYRQKFCSQKCQLLSKVVRTDSDNGCWNWGAAKTKAGYGIVMTANNGAMYAHRLMYQITFGEIGEGMFICHHCDNPSCINPSHLFMGTPQDNASDMARKGRAAWKSKPMPEEMRAKISATRAKSGWKPSEAQIKASHAAMAEKRKDPAWVAARSAKMSGENNPNYGKKMSEETRKKLSAHWANGSGSKGRRHSEETKQKMREAALRRCESNTSPQPLRGLTARRQAEYKQCMGDAT